jgi:hypothetical protein
MSSEIHSISFLSHFEKIEDPRIGRHKIHSLFDILLIIFSGSICGAESWEYFVDFGESKLDYHRRWKQRVFLVKFFLWLSGSSLFVRRFVLEREFMITRVSKLTVNVRYSDHFRISKCTIE